DRSRRAGDARADPRTRPSGGLPWHSARGQGSARPRHPSGGPPGRRQPGDPGARHQPAGGAPARGRRGGHRRPHPHRAEELKWILEAGKACLVGGGGRTLSQGGFLYVAYIIVPILLIAVVLAAVWLERWSVPVILVALGLGIVFGSDVLKLLEFHDFVLTNQVANLALVFILFQGGFSTSLENFRAVALPAGGLAAWGVALTALVLFACLRFGLGWPLELSVLLAVIISSTDAAAIFSILRRQSLPQRLASTVEIESAANDPMAILLTTVAITAFTSGEALGWGTVLSF